METYERQGGELMGRRNKQTIRCKLENDKDMKYKQMDKNETTRRKKKVVK